MRYKNLLTAIAVFAASSMYAQQPANYAFVITSPQNAKNVGWTEVKMVNLSTGKLVQNVFEPKNNYTLFDARSNKLIRSSINAQQLQPNKTQPVSNAPNANTATMREPFDTYCAAAAYDAKHQRLYYTPMGINQLRYIEPSSGKIYYFSNETFGIAKDLNDLPNHITRMTIDANGIGYALSNDGNHLISFTTDKKPVITDLGSITDAATNKEVSIHNQCSSWGGDMVADKFGNLFMISAHQALFKIEIASKEAKFLGYVTGFPQGFASNGAAVNDDGDLIVSSAASSLGYYTVDIAAMTAKKYSVSDSVYIGSDLANGNFLFDKKTLVKPPLYGTLDRSKISIYPNPVMNGIVRANFNDLPTGQYTFQLMDETGKILTQKSVDVKFAGQLEELEMGNRLTKGVYLLKVTSQNKLQTSVTKVMVQ